MRPLIAVGCGIAVALAGCSRQEDPPAEAAPSMTMEMDMASYAPEGQLDIVARPDHV